MSQDIIIMVNSIYIKIVIICRKDGYGRPNTTGMAILSSM